VQKHAQRAERGEPRHGQKEHGHRREKERHPRAMRYAGPCQALFSSSVIKTTL
jgi:hypothetical protein